MISTDDAYVTGNADPISAQVSGSVTVVNHKDTNYVRPVSYTHLDGPPLVSAAALGDSNTGMHLLIGLLAALLHREKTGRGQRVTMSMQDAVLNLCRVKLRDQQRLDKLGYLEEYPQYPNGTFGDAVTRGGNAGGGGQPGWILKCKGWETDPNAYIYFTIQEQNWENTCKAIGKPEWITDPAYSTAHARPVSYTHLDVYKRQVY